MTESSTEGKLGFVDAVVRIFRGVQEPTEQDSTQHQDERLGKAGIEFEDAVAAVVKRIEALRPPEEVRVATKSSAPADATDEERMKAHRERFAEIHARIRTEIEEMHATLGTGVGASELDAILEDLAEIEEIAVRGEGSHEFLPRAQYAIAERLRAESGELSISRLRVLLERAQIGWPDPTHSDAHATPEQIERSRRRRMAETREAFLGQGFARISERAVGIVKGWGTDYPDPGSPLWQEAVLEGVAAGLRGHLLREFLGLLRRERERLVEAIEGLVGKEVGELRGLVESGLDSIEQANLAVAGALKAMDEVAPEVVWKLVEELQPLARGDWDASSA